MPEKYERINPGRLVRRGAELALVMGVTKTGIRLVSYSQGKKVIIDVPGTEPVEVLEDAQTQEAFMGALTNINRFYVEIVRHKNQWMLARNLRDEAKCIVCSHDWPRGIHEQVFLQKPPVHEDLLRVIASVGAAGNASIPTVNLLPCLVAMAAGARSEEEARVIAAISAKPVLEAVILQGIALFEKSDRAVLAKAVARMCGGGDNKADGRCQLFGESGRSSDEIDKDIIGSLINDAALYKACWIASKNYYFGLGWCHLALACARMAWKDKRVKGLWKVRPPLYLLMLDERMPRMLAGMARAKEEMLKSVVAKSDPRVFMGEFSANNLNWLLGGARPQTPKAVPRLALSIERGLTSNRLPEGPFMEVLLKMDESVECRQWALRHIGRALSGEGNRDDRRFKGSLRVIPPSIVWEWVFDAKEEVKVRTAILKAYAPMAGNEETKQKLKEKGAAVIAKCELSGDAVELRRFLGVVPVLSKMEGGTCFPDGVRPTIISLAQKLPVWLPRLDEASQDVFWQWVGEFPEAIAGALSINGMAELMGCARPVKVMDRRGCVLLMTEAAQAEHADHAAVLENLLRRGLFPRREAPGIWGVVPVEVWQSFCEVVQRNLGAAITGRLEAMVKEQGRLLSELSARLAVMGGEIEAVLQNVEQSCGAGAHHQQPLFQARVDDAPLLSEVRRLHSDWLKEGASMNALEFCSFGERFLRTVKAFRDWEMRPVRQAQLFVAGRLAERIANIERQSAAVEAAGDRARYLALRNVLKRWGLFPVETELGERVSGDAVSADKHLLPPIDGVVAWWSVRTRGLAAEDGEVFVKAEIEPLGMP